MAAPGPDCDSSLLGFQIALAVLVAYCVKRRGYNFWVFLVAAGLFDIFASALILISLPQRDDKTA